MKTRLRILNVFLLLCCALVAWQMRANHVEASSRMEKTFHSTAKAAPAGEVSVEAVAAAKPASAFSEVAMRTMFAQDRNPNVVEEKKPEPEPKKMPPLPVLHGVINFGDGPMAMMSEDAGAKQGSYKAGDSIGEFKVVNVSKEKITFEWDGKEVVKTAAELKSQTPAPAKKSTRDNVPKAQAAVESTPPPPPSKPGPGKDTGGRERACQPGEKSPDGTVVDGWVKKTTYSPMGAVCYWEPVGQ